MKKTVSQYVEKNRDNILEEFKEILRVPSISALPENFPDLQRMAGFLLEKLQQLGFEGEIYDPGNNPVVFAKRCPHPDGKTYLIYGHHDVMPVDPLDLWESDPFEPDVRDGVLYARGASDDKGQIFAAIKGVEAILEADGEMPVNVIFMIEGAEESGSRNIEKFFDHFADQLNVNGVMILDATQYKLGTPAITYGLRGNVYMQIDVQGPAVDLHSGTFGGCIQNPAIALSQIIAKLKSDDNRITVPGFFDDVVPPQKWEREQLKDIPFDDQEMRDFLQVDTLLAEPGYTVPESMTLRPTLDICGLWGGFSGHGAKTIIPSKAGAKISYRIVPNQKPEKLEAQLREYVESIAPAGVKVKVTAFEAMKPMFIESNQELLQKAGEALKDVYGKDPVYVRFGASIGVAEIFLQRLNTSAILITGWGSPTDNLHAPNEHFHLDDFYRGIETVARLLYRLGEN